MVGQTSAKEDKGINVKNHYFKIVLEKKNGKTVKLEDFLKESDINLVRNFELFEIICLFLVFIEK